MFSCFHRGLQFTLRSLFVIERNHNIKLMLYKPNICVMLYDLLINNMYSTSCLTVLQLFLARVNTCAIFFIL